MTLREALMDKIDLKKEFKDFYKVSAIEVGFVTVPPIEFLMIDGRGAPAGEEYMNAVPALYSLAYTMKFAAKKDGVDYTVMPLEGLWWAEDMAAFTENRQDEWEWTAMIATPDFVTDAQLASAKEAVKQKKGNLPGLDEVRLEVFNEGLSAQITHMGSYDAEGPTIERLHAAIKSNGYMLRGKHHEIYLNDPSRTAIEKVKTIIRQPVE
jgi:hypothetical protein